MTDYRLNPFCFITDTPQGIILNAVPELRVTFERQHRPIIDFLIARQNVSEADLLKLIAPTRLQELRAKKVLLDGPGEALQGRYSRQNGYFSMTTDAPDAVSHRLAHAHVLILGVGAIGSHVLWNLAAIGVGKITILDFDTVEESNFNRQLMYGPDDLGESKVKVIADKIGAFNPLIEIVALDRKIECEADVRVLLDDVDLVVKAIDTPEESNGWVNSACIAAKVPFVLGGFMDFVGVVGPNYIPGRSTCFACLGAAGEVRRLHGTGATFAPLTTIVSSKLAMIAYKILIKEDAPFADKVFSYDTRIGRWQVQEVAPEQTCPECGAEPAPAVVDDPRARNIRLYRWSLVALMALTLVLREFYGQQLVGVLTFCAVLMTVPVVAAIESQHPSRARREFFVVACIYILFSIAALVLERFLDGAVGVPRSLPALFDGARIVCVFVTQAAISVTILFLSMCALLEYIPRVMHFLNQDISEA